MPNVVEKTFASAMKKELLQRGYNVTITDKDGKILDDNAFVGTGCIVSDENGNSYTVVVCGDTDGTGIVDLTDYMKVKSVFMDVSSLEGPYALAADTDGNGNIDSTDYLRIKGYFIGAMDIYKK